MPIINRPGDEPQSIEAEKPSGIVSRDTPEAAQSDGTRIGASFDGKRNFNPIPVMIITALFLLVGGGFFVIRSLPAAEEAHVNRERIELAIDRMARIQSIVSLLDKRIENSQTALSGAEERNDKLMIDTLRATLAQNLSDRDDHLDKMVLALSQLSEEYRKDSDLTAQVFRDFVNESEDQYKAGRIAAAGRALELLEDASEHEEVEAYFREQLGLE